MKQNPVYQEKLDRLNKALDHGTPDRVPVFPILETWQYFAAGVNFVDAMTKDPNICFSAFQKVSDEVYLDAFFGTANSVPLKMMSNFGEGIYTFTEKGIQIKGGHGRVMEASEYPELIADPMAFMLETIIPRKYPDILKMKEDNTLLATWLKSMKDVLGFLRYNKSVIKRIENELHTPVFPKATCIMPGDVIFDFFRDFVGVSQDIRRCPELFLEAQEALIPIMVRMVEGAWGKPDRSGIVLFPLHLPTYIRPKDFEKYYFPVMKEMIRILSAKGYSMGFAFENDWSRHIDYLQDLPEARMLGVFEKGDLKHYKELLKDKITVMGGFQVDIFRYGTKEQCIDEAKRCLEEYAPGGNYIFSTNINLETLEDCSIDKLAAVCDYVHTHGKY